MSTAITAQPSSSQSKLSHDTGRPGSRSSPRTTAVAYGPIGGTKPTNNNNGHRKTPGSPRSPNEDERNAALSIQHLSSGQFSKTSPASRSKPLSDTSPSTVPKIKTERPSSPEPLQRTSSQQQLQQSRHRPRRLDLTNDMPAGRSRASVEAEGPLGSRDAVTLSAIQDVGLACLSPGFQTQDPEKQNALEKSMRMREQQRQIIESRLHNKAIGKDVENEKARSSGDSPAGGSSTNNFPKPAAAPARRKGPPAGLSISAPSAHQFTNEPRVVQSAPINQTFTGLNKPTPVPLSRQVLEHTHHHNPYHAMSAINNTPQFVPLGGPQNTNQRLPPIADVVASQDMNDAQAQQQHHLPNNPYDNRDHPRDGRTLFAPINNKAGLLPSPGYPPPSAGLHPPHEASTSRSRERDFRSADDAVHSLSGGREDLLPKLVHYGAHQPPTPPSPFANGRPAKVTGSAPPQPSYGPVTNATPSSNGTRPEPVNRQPSGSSRRRNRAEFEADHRAESDRMDVDREDREQRQQRARLGDREENSRGAAAHFEEAIRGTIRDREVFGRVDDRNPASGDRMRRKREEFLSLCARAWDMLHED